MGKHQPKVKVPGDSFANRKIMYKIAAVEKVKADLWLTNFCGALGWLFLANFGMIWFGMHAFMGDFEGMFWFMKQYRLLLPTSIIRS